MDDRTLTKMALDELLALHQSVASILASRLETKKREIEDRGMPPSEREAEFIHLRDAIEKIVSDNFQGETAALGRVVRVFAKHLPQERKKILEY